MSDWVNSMSNHALSPQLLMAMKTLVVSSKERFYQCERTIWKWQVDDNEFTSSKRHEAVETKLDDGLKEPKEKQESQQISNDMRRIAKGSH